MDVASLADELEQIAPLHHAEAWDNVGLLVGARDWPVTRVLLCIDLTRAVLDEAIRIKADAVIAYHPPIFKTLNRLDPSLPAVRAFAAKIAVYSPHTALDVAAGGTNDVLAGVMGLTDTRPLRPSVIAGGIKLVTFVPKENLDAVAAALFATGGGGIGNYSQCSFRHDGIGTFRGNDASHPTIGQPGVTERVAETRIEMLVARPHLTEVLAALRTAHPYEEPAFDLIELATPPTDIGLGRVGTLERIERRALIERIKTSLGLPRLLIAGPIEGELDTAACCAGSCGDLLDDALCARAGLYLTGEMKHHDALRAAAAGMTVVCTLHSNSERKTLHVLAERLRRSLGVPCEVAESDVDPFVII